MNVLGKTLVLIHLALSVLALGWALMLFLQFLDLGWMEPKKVLDQRIASEFDKRTLAHRQAVKASTLVIADMEKQASNLFQARAAFPANHLLYVSELERLKTGTSDLPQEYKQPVWKDGVPTASDGKPFSAPDLTATVEGIEHPLVKYMDDLRNLQKQVDQERERSMAWFERHAQITVLLNGEKVKDVTVKPGLYSLLDQEQQLQDKSKFEKEYLEPIWASALERAEVFLGRRDSLQNTIERLKAARKEPR